jgi:hypothetical protein
MSAGCVLFLGRDAEAMRKPIFVGKKELGLAVFSIFEFRDGKPKVLQSVSGFVYIRRRLVE